MTLTATAINLRLSKLLTLTTLTVTAINLKAIENLNTHDINRNSD